MSNWEWKKLGDVAEIARGGSPRPIKEFITTEDNGINWIKIGDTDPTGKYIFETEEKIKPSGMKRSRYVEKGDFLLSNSMSFGRPYILMTDGCIHDGWLVLRKYQKLLDIDFFYHLLTSPFVQDQFEREARGSTVRNLNTDIVSKIVIPIPPLAEQKRIVKTLDEKFAKIDKLKTAAETNLKNAREIFNAELNSRLNVENENLPQGWKLFKMRDVCDVRDGTHDSPKYQKDGFPLVTSKNLKNGSLDMQNIKFISKKDYDSINKRSKVDVGDILYAMIGTIGNPVLIVEEPNYAIKNVALFKPLSVIESRYLFHFLCSSNILNKMQNESNGTTQKFVGLDYLRNFQIPLPPLSEQKRIVAHLDKLSEKVKRLEEIYRRTIADCEELKKSILKKTFEGES